jgi:fibrillarin-like pre-rRNA processing protein
MNRGNADSLATKLTEIFPGVYSVADPKNPNKRLLATKNLTPGRVYYGEHTVRLQLRGQTQEFRFWDPFRSKLSASILRGLKIMPFSEGGVCLYLGASTGTTVSHLSDILGNSGRIFAVEMASRVARELLENVTRYRKNIVPVIADARHPENFPSVYGTVNTIYCDIAQPDQTEIAISNCERFFTSKSEILFLVVKASSIDVLKDKGQVFDEQTKILKQAGFKVVQKIDLQPYDKNHAMIISQRSEDSDGKQFEES